MSELETRISQIRQYAMGDEELPHARYMKMKALPVQDVELTEYAGMEVKEIWNTWGVPHPINEDYTKPIPETRDSLVITMIFGFAIDRDEDNQTLKITVYVRNWDVEWEEVLTLILGQNMYPEQVTEGMYKSLASLATTDLRRRWTHG